MNYDLPDLPVNRRWRVAPAAINWCVRLHLEEKRWWGWKSLDYAVVRKDELDTHIRWHANLILESLVINDSVQYGVKEGTL